MLLMRLVMTLLVRDEEDILSANIEYHRQQGVDFFLVTDNCSCDRTSEILEHYRQRGLLDCIYEPADTYEQHAWVTRMARRAAEEYGADWVVNNDADEFWWAESAPTLKEALRSVPRDVAAVAAERCNFIPRAVELDRPFYEAMLIRERESFVSPGRRLPAKVCHRGCADIEVEQGNHAVRLEGARVIAEPASIGILHFPLRTYRQFENKISKGGRAYENNDTLPNNFGWTWRVLYNRFKAGKLKDYYREQILSDQSISEGLRDGSLVEDARLRDALRRCPATELGWPPPPSWLS